MSDNPTTIAPRRARSKAATLRDGFNTLTLFFAFAFTGAVILGLIGP